MIIQSKDKIKVVPKHGEAMYRDLLCARLEESSNKDPETECLQTMWKCWITNVPAGVELKPHVHEGHEQIYYIIKGTGIISVGDEKKKVEAGDCIYMPTDIPHGFINDSGEEVEMFTVGANIFRPWLTKGVWERLKKAEEEK
jgi:mannose-6-phosphate isomerase-like protein (cupin superfamily)